jgi:hypothetical protein
MAAKPLPKKGNLMKGKAETPVALFVTSPGFRTAPRQ